MGGCCPFPNNLKDLDPSFKTDKGKRAEAGYCTSFKYLGAVVSDDGSKPEILSRLHKPLQVL